MKKLRVIQWATGTVGHHSVAAVHEHPELELVGAYVYSDAKAGRDVGEICGIGRIGVRATSDVKEILRIDADCVLYMPLGEMNPHGALDDICALLESGKNVVSTAVTALIHPQAMGAEVVDRLEAACAKGRVSFHATGIEPGWASEVLPLTMSPIFQRIDSLLVQEIMDYSNYKVPAVLFDIMGFGKRPDEPVLMQDAAVLKPTFSAPMMLVAKGCGAEIEDYRYHREIAITEHAFDVPVGHIKAGTVAAQRFSLTAIIGGRPAMTVEHVTRLRPDVAPHWPTGRGWKVTVEGRPSMVLESHIGIRGEDEVDQGCLATAMHAVHSVKPVCAALPGIRTFLDLPIITGRGVFGRTAPAHKPVADAPPVPARPEKVSSAFDEMVATMRQRVTQLPAFGKRLKFLLDDNIMFIDGTVSPPAVSTSDGPADAVITVSVEVFSKLLRKQINPMLAFMSGKVRLKGDMAAATALQKIF